MEDLSSLRRRRHARLSRYAAVVSLLIALITMGCERQPLSVGAVLPLTGADAEYGTSARQGMELAQAELKKTGKATNFVFNFADSESSADVALARYEELLADKVLITVGGFTPQEARVMAPVAAEHERVVLSPASDDQLLGAGNEYFYRLAPSAAVTGSTIASFAAQDMKLKSMVLLAETAAQGDALEEGLGSTFDRHGGEIVGRYDLDDAELSAALAEVGRLHPEAVTLAGWGHWLADTVQALHGAGYRGKIFTPESFSAPSIRAAAGRSARGVMVAGSPFDPEADDGPAHAFAEVYRARYDTEPDLYAAAGWDTVLVLAAALEGHPNLPGAVRQWLRDDVKDITGVIGYLQFNGTGEATKYPRVYSVAADLSLHDHSHWLEQERQRIAERKKILEEKKKAILEQLRNQAAGGNVPDPRADGSQVASSG